MEEATKEGRGGQAERSRGRMAWLGEGDGKGSGGKLADEGGSRREEEEKGEEKRKMGGGVKNGGRDEKDHIVKELFEVCQPDNACCCIEERQQMPRAVFDFLVNQVLK
uniref:Uncharacterized protein n=1 Tax=Guillardia theta TaxID=55529 RepID=A0A7S4NWZ0_GUITH